MNGELLPRLDMSQGFTRWPAVVVSDLDGTAYIYKPDDGNESLDEVIKNIVKAVYGAKWQSPGAVQLHQRIYDLYSSFNHVERQRVG